MREREKRNNKNRRWKEKGPQDDREKVTVPRIELPRLECAYCHEVIREPASALGSREDGSPVHFDCALKKVTEEEQPQGDDRVCYMGSGNFALVQYKSQGGPIKQVKKLIPFEHKEGVATWRRTMSYHPPT